MSVHNPSSTVARWNPETGKSQKCIGLPSSTNIWWKNNQRGPVSNKVESDDCTCDRPLSLASMPRLLYHPTLVPLPHTHRGRTYRRTYSVSINSILIIHKNEVLIHAIKQMNLKNRKLSQVGQKGPTCDSTLNVKCPEKDNLQRKKISQ